MKIDTIKIKNFRSFLEEEIHLDKFNVLIGANASGKSNFVQVLHFLRDLSQYGIENAISMQGGLDYTLNMKIGRSEKLSVEFTSDVSIIWPWFFLTRRETGLLIRKINYCVTLDFSKSRTSFKIDEDKIIYRCEIYDIEKNKAYSIEEYTEDKKIGEVELTFKKVKELVSLFIKPIAGGKKMVEERFELDDVNDIFSSWKLEEKEILLQQELPLVFENHAKKQVEGIVVYDIDPKLLKKAQTITGKVDLEEDGSNLAIVVNNIIRTGKRKRFLDILSSNLKFIENVQPKRAANSMIFHLRETYYENKLLPGFLVSDGTINFTALVVALFFQEKTLKVIEEPERNIHPYLISRVLDMMRDASENEQIIATSHNPEVVRYANTNEILLAKRSKKGFTNIYKPSEKEEIRAFLSGEMGMADLYVQRLLEEYT